MNRKKSYLQTWKKKAAVFVLMIASSVYLGCFCVYAEAPVWPTDTGIEAEAGIVVDEVTGTVLYGNNIHVPHAPASITKLLTALVVIENSPSLDDLVVFSHDAVYNVESGSGNGLSLEEGDQLTVRDCLYALLLRSSNQAANALAEHVGGSRDGFVAMMNAKIRQLGCTESNFANPSGLNDENQYVTAYDMALIGRAAFQNETLMQIDSTINYSLPATINNPEGISMGMEHKLLITTDENSPTYYPAAIAGKTGYTSIAGNTLVTCARQGERGLVSVVLQSNQTHYSDTIALMNFGFQYFQNLDSTGSEAFLFQEDQTLTVGDQTYRREDLNIVGSRLVTVPLGATLADAFQELIVGDAMGVHPEGAVAEIRYTYHDRVVGSSFFVPVVPETEEASTEGESLPGGEDGEAESGQNSDSVDASGEPNSGINPEEKTRIAMIGIILVGAGLLVGAGAGTAFLLRKRWKEKKELEEKRRERRKQRLAEIGCSEEEFKRMVKERFKD